MSVDKQNEERFENENRVAEKACGVLGLTDIDEDGKRATEAEHSLSVLNGIKVYPKAVGWSVLVSMAIVMDGYDTSLLSIFYAYPAFQRKYGNPFDGGYQVSAAWQSGLSAAAVIGRMIAIFANGVLIERFGYKRVMQAGYIFMALFILILFFAPTTAILLVGEIFCGLSWGSFSTLAPAYAADVAPLVLRGYLTSYVNLCWVFGQLMAAGVLQSMQARTDQWAYRIPFALQWIWPVPLFAIICFAPESPWWLVRKGRLENAERSLQRLSQKPRETRQTLALIVHTNELEKQNETGTTWGDCFRGHDRRRTEISSVAMAAQTLAGLTFGQNGTYFFEQAGMSASNSFKMNLGYNGIALVGTVASWVLISYWGRRTVYIFGLSLMTTIMFIIGFLSLAPSTNKGSIWAQATLLLVWIFFYDLTIGPVAFIVMSETSATRLRQKTIAIARNAHNLCSILSTVISPYMLNPEEGNWKGKTGFFWGALSLLCTIWTYFRLVEAKGRTYEELDILFQKAVKAKDFKRHEIDPYSVDAE